MKLTYEERRILYSFYQMLAEPSRPHVIRSLIQKGVVRPETSLIEPKVWLLTEKGAQVARQLPDQVSQLANDLLELRRWMQQFADAPLAFSAQQLIQLEEEGVVYYHKGEWCLSVLGRVLTRTRLRKEVIHIPLQITSFSELMSSTGNRRP